MSVSIKFSSLSKKFRDITALNDVSISFRKGGIHTIIGENGSGKTTIANILAGETTPDHGKILIENKEVTFNSTAEALKNGVGLVRKDPILVPSLSVLENITLGAEPKKGFNFDTNEAKKIIDPFVQLINPFLHLNNPVDSCTELEKYQVEIIKLLYRKVDVFIFDEITIKLTATEKKWLFNLMKQLKEKGKTILFLTKKLKELMEVSDEATVLIKGKVAGSFKISETSQTEIAKIIIGTKNTNPALVLGAKKVSESARYIEKPMMTPILSARNLTVLDSEDVPILEDVSFRIYRKEILGLVGKKGSGKRELLETIIGLRDHHEGVLLLNGERLDHTNVKERRERGICYIPEEIKKEGLIYDFNVYENLAIGHQWTKDQDELKEYAINLSNEFEINPLFLGKKVRHLSSGTKKRILFGRELTSDIKLSLFENPSQGIDLETSDFIHKRIIQLKSKGKPVLLASNDFDEIYMLCDRVLVMANGKIVAEVNPKHVTETEIGLLMVK